MFDTLTEKLNSSLSKLNKKGTISEKDLDNTLKEVRLSMLEADVDYKVTREFVLNLKEKLKNSNVFSSLSPGQSVVKYVQEEVKKEISSFCSDFPLPH